MIRHARPMAEVRRAARLEQLRLVGGALLMAAAVVTFIVLAILFGPTTGASS